MGAPRHLASTELAAPHLLHSLYPYPEMDLPSFFGAPCPSPHVRKPPPPQAESEEVQAQTWVEAEKAEEDKGECASHFTHHFHMTSCHHSVSPQ